MRSTIWVCVEPFFGEAITDGILAVSRSLVEEKFKSAWKDKSSPIPAIRRVFKIIENEDFQKPYERYRFVFREQVKGILAG